MDSASTCRGRRQRESAIATYRHIRHEAERRPLHLLGRAFGDTRRSSERVRAARSGRDNQDKLSTIRLGHVAQHAEQFTE